MERIKKLIAELDGELNDYKPTRAEQNKIVRLKNLVGLMNNISKFESRIKPGTPVVKQTEEKPKAKKKRGRPKKENVLAQSGNKKNLTEQLAKDAKK